MRIIAPSLACRFLPVAALALAAACGGDSAAPIAVASVEVSLAASTILTGQTTQATAVVKDAAGASLAGRGVTWTSSNTAVATISGTTATVTLTAVSPGTSTITATSEGRSATATLTVSAPVASVTLTLASTTLTSNGTTQATATPKDGSGNALTGRTITFASSNTAVATVGATSGLVTAVGPGTSIISATAEGQTGSATVTVCQAGIVPVASASATTYVSAASGNDATGTGSCAAPFKTITKGVTGAASGTVIRVSPGTYNTALGETFPINLPAGVQLIGDEANKGQGSTATKIIGGAYIALAGACGAYGTTIYAGANAIIAGFELTNGVNAFAQFTLLLRNDGVVVRNNSLVNNPNNAIYLCNGSVNQLIAGNRIRSNAGVGIGFIGGGVGSKVENNVITNNSYGIEYDSRGGDLGGGALGSVGGNVISCNAVNDLWTNLGNSFTIEAANNFWDHVPLSGNDVFNPNGVALLTTGAQVATGNCP